MSTVGFQDLLEEVWIWLVDKRIDTICIWGMVGTGKTTLLRLIREKLGSTSYTLIWVTVSRNFKLGDVQDEIWRRIGSYDQRWVEKSSREKAKCINDVLQQSKFILFLDDVWETIDLRKLGVSYRTTQNNSKVIFTTRLEGVRRAMQPGKSFKITRLSQKDAWSLFQMKVGQHLLAIDPRIIDLAKLIAVECAGLPILLCTVARAMACRLTYYDWEGAFQELKSYQKEKKPSTEESMLSLLRFCYDSLPDDIVKTCFSFFSLFPEDFAILKNDLIDFWISEGFSDCFDSKDSAIIWGSKVIDILINANVFEEENGSVKMLDLIRDFASSVASEFKIFNDAQLIEVSTSHGLDGVGKVSSMRSSLQNLPNITLDLQTSFLQHNPFIMMRRHWVRFKAELTVLDLSNSCIEEVPRGISELVSLQHLNLSCTWIERLPIELKKLVKLKCLNLENDDQLRIIPRRMLSSLSSLRVLRMFRCGFSLLQEDNILFAMDMDISELHCLEDLKVLSITITCVSALENLLNSQKLLKCTHAISLELFWGTQSLNISSLVAMEHLLTLEIHHAEHLKVLKFNPMDRSFIRLREVNVEKCSNVQDLTWLILAPNLAILKVSSCGEMEEIINMGKLMKNWGVDKKPFAKLEVLDLISLHKLKNIYGKPLPLQFLKRIQVLDCPKLNKLPLNYENARKNELVIKAEQDWWEEIIWEDDASKATFSQCFIPILE